MQITLAVPSFLCVVGAILLMQWLLPSIPGWGHIFALILVLLAVSMITSRVRRKVAGGVLADLLIEEGLCPSCGYNLFGLSADQDGILPCPECGAGWRASRIRRVEAFATGVRMADAHTAISLAPVAWSARDDRGMRRPLVHPRLRREIAGAESEPARQRLRSARRAIGRSGRIVRWLAALFMLLPGAGICAAFLSGGMTPTLARALVVPGLFFVGLGCGALFGNFGYNPRRVRRLMVESQLCPSCAAPLDGIDPEADGRKVCGLCLGAWELPR
jgi:hypothetical protein